jgi:putative phosphoribosyl transferase
VIFTANRSAFAGSHDLEGAPMQPGIYQDRTTAGRTLAAELLPMGLSAPVVLALPRGGVPVGYEIAKALAAPLDLLLVRKIGVPWQPELAAAAVVDGDHPEVVLNDSVMAIAGISKAELDKMAERQVKEIERRRRVYLAGRTPLDVAGRSAIVVDDGIATGTTMRAALTALAGRNVRRLILAVPVAAAATIDELARLVDDVVCPLRPRDFAAIGEFYRDFHQLSDDEVIRILADSRASPQAR